MRSGRGFAPANQSPASVADPQRSIQELAAGKARAFAGTIDATTGEYLDDVYAQNKSLSEHVAADYHGRFLIELIQNGNDAHERNQRDGEIEVLLAPDEGAFGTLYLANRGRPFSYPNVVALVSIGMSSKPPGESIGTRDWDFAVSAMFAMRPKSIRSWRRLRRSLSSTAIASPLPPVPR
jgi:hypothetical protein